MIQKTINLHSENDKFTFWLSNLKNEIPIISENAQGFFDLIAKGVNIDTCVDYDLLIERFKLTDESLIKFLKDTNYGTKDLANYQEYLKNAGGGMTTFSSITQKVGSTLKSFGAALGSMAVMWAVGKVISLVATGIDNLVNSTEHCKERVDNLMSSYNCLIFLFIMYNHIVSLNSCI